MVVFAQCQKTRPTRQREFSGPRFCKSKRRIVRWNGMGGSSDRGRKRQGRRISKLLMRTVFRIAEQYTRKEKVEKTRTVWEGRGQAKKVAVGKM